MRVRQVCDKYDLHDTTGSLLVQYGKAWRRRKSLRQFFNDADAHLKRGST